MWEKSDWKSKWFHLVMMILFACIIFKLGVLVGEFKMMQKMIYMSPMHKTQWSDHKSDYMKFDKMEFLKMKALKGDYGAMEKKAPETDTETE